MKSSIEGTNNTFAQTSAEEGQDGTQAESKSQPVKATGQNDALARFTVNLTEKAAQGGIDPVFGRETEIRQMMDILSRRRKNNPILVGEPGVGKTALVEGLA